MPLANPLEQRSDIVQGNTFPIPCPDFLSYRQRLFVGRSAPSRNPLQATVDLANIVECGPFARFIPDFLLNRQRLFEVGQRRLVIPSGFE